jgi:hypothetical protein
MVVDDIPIGVKDETGNGTVTIHLCTLGLDLPQAQNMGLR